MLMDDASKKKIPENTLIRILLELKYFLNDDKGEEGEVFEKKKSMTSLTIENKLKTKIDLVKGDESGTNSMIVFRHW